MRIVTFMIDSTTRRESLSSIGLSLRESIVWINISREEYGIYREVEVFLSNAVKQNGLKHFVAVELLIFAASSVQALRRTLETWANANPRLVEGVGRHAQVYFKRLLEIIDLRLTEELVSTKLQLAFHLGRQCVVGNEKLVIFASSQDLVEDVHTFLSSRLDERKLYKHDASMHALNTKMHLLDDFSIVQGGAILVAAYGPTTICMEESGWGFINATRVLSSIVHGIHVHAHRQ